MAEAYDIFLVANHILEHNTPQSVIYTDWLSVVEALSSTVIQKQCHQSLLKTFISTYDSNIELTVCWVPGHSVIAGNETADQIAAAAVLTNTLHILTIPYTHLTPHIRKHLRNTCQ